MAILMPAIHGHWRWRLLVLGGLALVASAPALAGDIETGRTKANVCTGCHGQDGMSVNDIWPNLTGQRAGYLARQLHAFRAGTRVDPIMASFAGPLTDQDIADIAAYYAALQPEALTGPRKGRSP